MLYALLVPGILFAQSADDEPDDRRDWGRASQYQSLVSSLGDTPVAALPIPVVLGVEVRDLDENFGDPRGDGTRTHEGLDIIAMQGTPVVSPTDAVVTRTGNGASSGIYVRTANPGGEQFVYMHLSEIANGITAGKKVTRGEVIGFVGNTGNASGGGAHLHFEIRKNGATDPFPRLVNVFTLSERMVGVAQALECTSNSQLAQILTTKYASIFREAKAASIAIPSQVEALLTTSGGTAGGALGVPPAVPVTSPSGFGNIIYNETNSDIVAMQRVLMAKAAGPSSTRLKNTGATGYFGPLTKAALIEFQAANGLPGTGIVNDATFAKLFSSASPGSTPSTTSGFTRDLELGMSGADVRVLQIFLNSHGVLVAMSGAGSSGNESDYFGAKTKAALAAYQRAHDISPAVGYFGPKTRAYIATQ